MMKTKAKNKKITFLITTFMLVVFIAQVSNVAYAGPVINFTLVADLISGTAINDWYFYQPYGFDTPGNTKDQVLRLWSYKDNFNTHGSFLRDNNIFEVGYIYLLKFKVYYHRLEDNTIIPDFRVRVYPGPNEPNRWQDGAQLHISHPVLYGNPLGSNFTPSVLPEHTETKEYHLYFKLPDHFSYVMSQQPGVTNPNIGNYQIAFDIIDLEDTDYTLWKGGMVILQELKIYRAPLDSFVPSTISTNNLGSWIYLNKSGGDFIEPGHDYPPHPATGAPTLNFWVGSSQTNDNITYGTYLYPTPPDVTLEKGKLYHLRAKFSTDSAYPDPMNVPEYRLSVATTDHRLGSTIDYWSWSSPATGACASLAPRTPEPVPEGGPYGGGYDGGESSLYYDPGYYYDLYYEAPYTGTINPYNPNAGSIDGYSIFFDIVNQALLPMGADVNSNITLEELAITEAQPVYDSIGDFIVDYFEGWEGISYQKWGSSTLSWAYDTSVKKEGNRSIRFNYTYAGSGWGAVLQGRFPAPKNISAYNKVGLWIRGGTVGRASVAIQFVETGRPEGNETWSSSSPIIVNNDWQYYEFFLSDFQRTSEGYNYRFDKESIGSYQLFFSDNTANGLYWVDKIELLNAQPLLEVTPSTTFGTVWATPSNHRYQALTPINIRYGGIDTPWTVRVWTNNSPGDGAEPEKSGLVGADGTAYAPIKVWCVNYGPAGWQPGDPVPDPENDAYWTGAAAVWYRIPEKDEHTADPYTWRRLCWNDGLGSDAGLGGNFDIYIAIDTAGVKPQGYSTTLTVEYINQ